MSARELGEWTAFERVCGPILLHERVDFAAARLGGGMPTWDAPPPEERPKQTREEMIAVLRSLQRKK